MPRDAPRVLVGEVITPSRADRFQPAVAPPPPTTSWIFTGVYVMTLPLTLGLSLMFAPVSWMLGSRSKQ